MSGPVGDGPAALRQAEVYLEADRPDAALQLAGEALTADPDDVDALLIQAQAEQALDRPGEAVRAARRAVTISPDAERAWRVLALALSQAGATPAAVEAAQRSLQLAPDLWLSHLVLSEVSRLAKDHDSRWLAVEAGQKAVELAPEQPAAHIAYGNARWAVEHQGQAIGAYQEALRLDPDHAVARMNLGAIYAADNRLTESTDLLAGVLAVAPGERYATSHFLATAATMAARLIVLGVMTLTVTIVMVYGMSDGPTVTAWTAATISMAGLVFGTVLAFRWLRVRPALAETVIRESRVLAVGVVLGGLSLLTAAVLYAAQAPRDVTESVVVTAIVIGLTLQAIGRLGPELRREDAGLKEISERASITARRVNERN